MRYQRNTRVLGELVRLHTSSAGVSLSVGVPGLRVNIPVAGKPGRKPSITAGIPGSGFSHTQRL